MTLPDDVCFYQCMLNGLVFVCEAKLDNIDDVKKVHQGANVIRVSPCLRGADD